MKEQTQQPPPQQSRQTASRIIRYGSLCAFLLQGLLVLSLSQTIVAAKQESQQLPPQQQLPTRALKKDSTPAKDKDADDTDDLWCKIVVFDVLYASTEEVEVAESKSDISTTTDIFYGCYPVTGDEVSELHYNIALPDVVTAAQPAAEDLDNWWVAIPGGFIDTTTAAVVVPDASTVYTTKGPPTGRRLSQQQLEKHHSRRLAEAKGTLKVLVVYIRASNASPTPSTNSVYQTAFQNEVSLKSQFARCSLNQLQLEPTALGVLDVTVNMRVGSTDKTQFVNAAEDLALARIRSITGDTSITNTRQYADLVMYIVPPGTGNWLAYASVGGGMSVYNDKWSIYLSATAHEIGHNFRLYHAGEGSSEYADHTGFMSGAIIGVHDKINFPKQCYNAQNHWDLGWYEAEKMQTITPTTQGKLVKIVAFSDVAIATASADKVLVRTGGNLDLYMQYNRAKGFNADTYEYKDKLVIVADIGTGTMIKATLDLDNKDVYTRQESGNSQPLRVEICSQVYSNMSTKPDYMLVGIGYSASTLCNPIPVVTPTATGLQQAVTGLATFTGLGGFTTQQVCIQMGQDCSYDEECCTNTCHNDKCGGATSIRDTAGESAFIIGYGDGGRERGSSRRLADRQGLRGLKN